VHQSFRRAYDEDARLVRAAVSAAPSRVAFLADHVDLTVLLLHVHHEGEDELLYPKLITRVPDLAGMTKEVEHEHEAIKECLSKVTAACAAWRSQPTAETNEALASSLDQLNAVATAHLDDEEQKVLPLAAETLTQAEWNALGEHAVKNIPAKSRPIAFGFLLEPLSPEDQAFLKRPLPAPVRLLFPVIMERPFKKYVATLRGGSA